MLLRPRGDRDKERKTYLSLTSCFQTELRRDPASFPPSCFRGVKGKKRKGDNLSSFDDPLTLRDALAGRGGIEKWERKREERGPRREDGYDACSLSVTGMRCTGGGGRGPLKERKEKEKKDTRRLGHLSYNPNACCPPTRRKRREKKRGRRR